MARDTPHTLISFAGELANTLAGLLIWAAHFALVYAVHAVACARGFAGIDVLGMNLIPFVILLATVLALLGSGVVLAIALRDLRRARGADDVSESQRFLTYTSATVAGFSMLAIVWVAVPALIVPPCA